MTNSSDSEPETLQRRATAFAMLKQGLGRAFGDIIGGAGNIIAPAVCLGCHARISSHDALCAACWQQVSFITPPLCDRLGCHSRSAVGMGL